MHFLIRLAVALCFSATASAQSIEGTSRAMQEGNRFTLDNTRFDFAFCNKERWLLKTRTTQTWTEQMKGSEALLRLDIFRPHETQPSRTIELQDGVAADFDLYNCRMTATLEREDLKWWLVHDLNTSLPLLKSMLRPQKFCLASKPNDQPFVRDCSFIYGFHVPDDDDLKGNLFTINSLGIMTLAHGSMVRRFHLTHDDPQVVRAMTSYWDESWTVSFVERKAGSPTVSWSSEKTIQERPLALKLSWSEAGVSVFIPITMDGLDLSSTVLPDGIRIEELAGPKN
ncbi:hypothetical protein ACFSM5_21990 [Lacibacterium aquatile]|uniref:DUF3108 domain-containing protein n=1 Tax=Lacibacterium aquatile TaxID=1168082 RepID=A0ABW5DYH6_9PROT